MRSPFPSWFAASAALPVLLLTACGGGSSTGTVDNSGTHGSLIQNPPPRLASLTATDFNAELNSLPGGSSLLQLATGKASGGAVPFGVDVYYFTYATTGGAGEACTATGALMVPTGATGSLGARPIVLYAHGTETYQPYNMANVANPYDNRIPMVAALFAGNGFIVVAPNYAGYDASNLPYHPYLNGNQQAGDMIDALKAARTALSSGNLFSSAPTDNGQLFITGYSQGGYVALATQKAIEAGGGTVTACAPGSGPYALGAFGDTIFGGAVNFGASEFAPLLTSSYYNSYKGNETIGNIFPATGGPADAYEAAWAATADTIAPGPVDLDTLIETGKWPLAIFNGTVPSTADIAAGVAMDGLTGAPSAGALEAGLAANFPSITPFPGNPLFALGFSSGSAPDLIKNSYRAAYAADAVVNPDGAVPTVTTGMPAAASLFPFRRALAFNDLRGAWAPKAPLLMIGGQNDPEVFFSVNTQLMASLWAGVTAPKGFVEPYYDVDPGLNMTTIAQAAGQAFGTDVASGVTSPATFAADINTAVGAYLATLTPGDALQAGFLQAVAQAVATEITTANLTAMITQATGTATPTTAQLGPVASALATGIGTATDTIIIEAYHSDLVAPFAHAAALQFFLKF